MFLIEHFWCADGRYSFNNVKLHLVQNSCLLIVGSQSTQVRHITCHWSIHAWDTNDYRKGRWKWTVTASSHRLLLAAAAALWLAHTRPFTHTHTHTPTESKSCVCVGFCAFRNDSLQTLWISLLILVQYFRCFSFPFSLSIFGRHVSFFVRPVTISALMKSFCVIIPSSGTDNRWIALVLTRTSHLFFPKP